MIFEFSWDKQDFWFLGTSSGSFFRTACTFGGGLQAYHKHTKGDFAFAS